MPYHDNGIGGSLSTCVAQAQLSDASSAVSALETELKAAEMKKKHLTKEGKDLEKKLAEARKAGGKQVCGLVGNRGAHTSRPSFPNRPARLPRVCVPLAGAPLKAVHLHAVACRRSSLLTSRSR
eukprot:3163811-Prymnesium_polylepis.1